MADEVFEPDFDVIIVGAGLAGSIAAYQLAKAGKAVLVLERGNNAGSKNMTGGRIYAHSLKKVFPETYQEAPFQRKVVHERISLIAPDSNFTVDFTSEDLKKAGQESYTVLRGTFDQWLAEQAENEGAEIIYDMTVNDLIINNGKVQGILVGEGEEAEPMTASLVILADGCNSQLTYKAGLSKIAPATHQVAVGAKETIKMSAKDIEARFHTAPGEGASWLFAGDCSNGVIGGAFIYANEESLSVGIVATMDEVLKQEKPVYQMLEDFKNRPEISALLAGGELIEYSGHVVPEGGFEMMPELVGDGVIVAGDSAMMCLNLGYTVRGMDFAVAAGDIAGQAAIKALDAGDTSKAGLAVYKSMLESSWVMRDMKFYAKAPHFLESAPGMFRGYPEMIRDIMNPLFIVDGGKREHVMGIALPPVKKAGLFSLAGVALKAVKAL